MALARVQHMAGRPIHLPQRCWHVWDYLQPSQPLSRTPAPSRLASGAEAAIGEASQSDYSPPSPSEAAPPGDVWWLIPRRPLPAPSPHWRGADTALGWPTRQRWQHMHPFATKAAADAEMEKVAAGQESPAPKAVIPVDATATLAPMKGQRLLRNLGLNSMSEEEMCEVFKGLDKNGDGELSECEVRQMMREKLFQNSKEVEPGVARFMSRFDHDRNGVVSYEEFSKTVTQMARTVDKRVWTIASCMGAAGLSVGMIVPLMPQLVDSLGLSVAQFGLATSAFGGAKMLANFPVAAVADRMGRVTLLKSSLVVMAASFAALGAATSAATLAAARALTGGSVTGFLSAATTYIVDISNPLNRASSMAPLFAAFSAGATAGPVIGGFLASFLGMNGTFAAAAAIYAGMAAFAHFRIPETLTSPAAPEGGASATPAAGKASGAVAGGWAWLQLLRNPNVFSVVCLNICVQGVQSGAQMTLLPLLLTHSLGMDAAAVGTVFAGMSLSNVLGAQLVAKISDRIGPQRLLGPGAMMAGGALLAMPYVADVPTLAAAVALWSVGNTVVGSNPTTYIVNVAPPHLRTQALALLRTTGDLGFLIGGVGAGTMASMTSIGEAMAASGAIFGGIAGLFLGRVLLQSRTAPTPTKLT